MSAKKQGYEYDFNVIYNHAKSYHSETKDTKTSLEFTQFLVKKMEKYGLKKGYYHDRDALLGKDIFDELFRVVDSSQWTVLVVTPEFKKNSWSKYSCHAAFKKLMDEEKGERLLPIGVGIRETDMEDMHCTRTQIFFKLEKEEWSSREAEAVWDRMRRLLQSETENLHVQDSGGLPRTDQNMPLSQNTDSDQDQPEYQQVLNRCLPFLIDHLDPVYTLDHMTSAELLTDRQYNDISGNHKRSDKNRKIIMLVKNLTEADYKTFKTILIKTRQENVLEHLIGVENDIKKGRQKQMVTSSSPLNGSMAVPQQRSGVQIVNQTNIQQSHVTLVPSGSQCLTAGHQWQLGRNVMTGSSVPIASLEEDGGNSVAMETAAIADTAVNNAATANIDVGVAQQGQDIPTPNIDTAAQQHPDTPPQNAAVPPQDAGTPPQDAGTSPQNAAVPPQDAGTPPQDAGTPPQDAGTPPQNAAVPPQDAGTTQQISSIPPQNAGTTTQYTRTQTLPESVDEAPVNVTESSSEANFLSGVIEGINLRDDADLSVDYASMPMPPKELPLSNNKLASLDSGYCSPGHSVISPDLELREKIDPGQKDEDMAKDDSSDRRHGQQAEDLKTNETVGSNGDNNKTLGFNVQGQETENNYTTNNSDDTVGFDVNAEVVKANYTTNNSAGGNENVKDKTPDTLRHGPEGQEASVGATAGQVAGESPLEKVQVVEKLEAMKPETPKESLTSMSTNSVTPLSSNSPSGSPADKVCQEKPALSMATSMTNMCIRWFLQPECAFSSFETSLY